MHHVPPTTAAVQTHTTRAGYVGGRASHAPQCPLTALRCRRCHHRSAAPAPSTAGHHRCGPRQRAAQAGPETARRLDASRPPRCFGLPLHRARRGPTGRWASAHRRHTPPAVANKHGDCCAPWRWSRQRRGGTTGRGGGGTATPPPRVRGARALGWGRRPPPPRRRRASPADWQRRQQWVLAAQPPSGGPLSAAAAAAARGQTAPRRAPGPHKRPTGAWPPTQPRKIPTNAQHTRPHTSNKSRMRRDGGGNGPPPGARAASMHRERRSCSVGGARRRRGSGGRAPPQAHTANPPRRGWHAPPPRAHCRRASPRAAAAACSTGGTVASVLLVTAGGEWRRRTLDTVRSVLCAPHREGGA